MNGLIIVGSKSGSIYTSVQGQKPEEIMSSHNQGEVWGLDIVDNERIITSCDDNRVIVWNTQTHKKDEEFIVNSVAKKNARKGASTISSLPDSQCSRAVLMHKGMPIVAANNG